MIEGGWSCVEASGALQITVFAGSSEIEDDVFWADSGGLGVTRIVGRPSTGDEAVLAVAGVGRVMRS